MLLDTLDASLLGNILADKGMDRAGERFIRAGYGYSIKKKKNLISPHSLTNFEIQKYYQNKLRFNGNYFSDNLPDKTNDRAYVINLDEYSEIGTHWIALCALNNNVTYFGVEHIPKEIKVFFDKSIVLTNIFRIPANDSIMCGYFCVGFIDFLLKGKTLTDFTIFFSPNNFKKNDDVILKYFMTNV